MIYEFLVKKKIEKDIFCSAGQLKCLKNLENEKHS